MSFVSGHSRFDGNNCRTNRFADSRSMKAEYEYVDD
jgi:hypothetical protein